ncbi:MAG TPA: glycosyltransferase family 2 protein [Syntrophorhabdaceae bacterium]|nr:glycosyltransferase family 2 protein [Syntrophorhabdaceae bacterium]HPP06687.1 glycosyltransferase family 2 protein [Syntrophorhabdaceae bacterium]
MAAVTIVIPNMNGEGLLPVPLESLKKQTFKDFEIIVVDNCSSDGSLNLIKREYPYVKIIPLDKNYGFAYAVNRGIEASSSLFVSLLNNDIELDSNWLWYLYEALIKHPEAGSCGPKLMRYWERERINVLGIRLNRDGGVEIVGAGEVDRGQYEEMKYVFGVNAGASLYRKKMFEDIGMFDETFFASFEDVDLSFRAQLAGYKALYVPKAIAYHMVGATIKRKRYMATYLNNRNSTMFFWKDMPKELIKKHLFYIFYRRTYAFFKRVLFNFWKIRTYYFIKGTIAAYLRMPYILRERKKIQSSMRVSIDYIESILDKDFISIP